MGHLWQNRRGDVYTALFAPNQSCPSKTKPRLRERRGTLLGLRKSFWQLGPGAWVFTPLPSVHVVPELRIQQGLSCGTFNGHMLIQEAPKTSNEPSSSCERPTTVFHRKGGLQQVVFHLIPANACCARTTGRSSVPIREENRVVRAELAQQSRHVHMIQGLCWRFASRCLQSHL